MLRRRHARYFLEIAEGLALAVEAYEGAVTPRYEIAVAEHDNMRGAIAWSVDADVELGLRLAVALEQFWVARNPFEGVRTLTSLLEAAADIEPRLLARALRCLGGCLTISGEAERAKPVYERSLAIYQRLEDEWGVVHMRHRLVTTALAAGDASFARQTLEENLLHAKSLESPYLEGEALSVLGVLAGREGRWEEAVDLLRRSQEIARAVGFRWREAVDLGNLAEALLALGRAHEAQDYARDAVALSREMDDRMTTVASLAMLARTARALGEEARAGRLWGAIEAEEARAPLGRWHRYRDEFAVTVVDPTSTEFERGRSEGRAQSLRSAVEGALAPN